VVQVKVGFCALVLLSVRAGRPEEAERVRPGVAVVC